MIEEDDLDLGSMPSDWSVSDIQNETLFVTDYVANGSFASLAENVNYKNEPDYAVLIRLTDFNNDFKGNFVYVDEHAYNFLAKSKLFGGEIIISNVGAYAGTTFLAPRLNRPMTLGPNAIMMNFKSGNEFYFYWLKSPVGKFLLDGIISGSAQPKFNKTTFRQLKVPVPPIEEQKAIASVLSSLDDKIDLLHRQNTTLERMAETLFRQWFVEEAQEDWEEKPLSFYGEIVCGKTPSKQNHSYFNGDVPFIKIPDMHGNTFIFKTEDTLTELGQSSQNNKTVPPYSICVSCIATVGLVSITTKPSQTNQQINTIIPNHSKYRYFLYLTMKASYDLLHAEASGGTATLNLNTGNFSRITVPLPPDSLLLEFETIVDKVFNKIYQNQAQIQTLEKLRDNLLPKLMSGEVRVA